MVTVDIMMLVYNHERFIREAMEGVLMQETTFPIRLNVFNDKSPDHTHDVISDIIANHPKGSLVRYFNHPQNLGMMANSTFAINQCDGKFVAICEGDDYWTDPLKLQKQVDFLEQHEEYGLVYTDVDIYYQNTDTFKKSIFHTLAFTPYTDYKDLIMLRYIAPCSWLLKNSLLREIGNEEVQKNAIDGTFVTMLLFSLKSRIHFLDEVTAVYRALPESASSSKNPFKIYEREVQLWETQHYFLNHYQHLPNEDEINNIFLNKCLLSVFLYKDWPTFEAIKKISIPAGNKFRLLISIVKNKITFNILASLFKVKYAALIKEAKRAY